MRKELILVFVVAVFFTGPRVSEADQWAKAYGGSGPDWMSSVQETSDGGSIVAGYTESFGRPGASNMWVIKLAADDSISWERTYSGVPYDWASSIKETADGGYIIAGYTECFGAQEGDVWVIKVDNSGDVLWERRYGGEFSDEATCVQQTDDDEDGQQDDGYIVGGRTKSFGSSVSDMWVIKLTGVGDITWENRYGETDFDIARSIEQTSDGGYIIAGDTWHAASGTTVNSDMAVVKLNADGSIQWQKAYGDIDSDTACCVQETPDGGYILVGDTRSFTSISDIWVLKLTSTGAITWQKTYGGNWSYASALDQTSDGGYIVAGITHDFGAGFSDILLLKLDSAGAITWQNVYGGSGFEWGHAVEETTLGEYLVAGRTQSFGAGGDDTLLLKVDSNGEIPDCSIIETSAMTATDTAIVPVDATLSGTATSAIIFDTIAWVDDTSAEIEPICPLSGIDSDEDGISDQLDNCPETANLGQEDSYPPPDGNGCGDICECEGNFNAGEDDDVDGSDAAVFKADFGRGGYSGSCTSSEPCNGDFNCDSDVDGTDAAIFKADFGRGGYSSPCPPCLTAPWCTY